MRHRQRLTKENKMETHARHFLIGIFTLAIAATLLLFALWLGKLELGKDYQQYDIRFEESVAGLAKGGLVQFQGVQVGEVRKLKLDPLDSRVVIVRVRMGEETPIKTDTKAQLSFTGLTGVAVIELIGGTPGAKLLREATHDSVPVIASIPSTLTKLMVDGTSVLEKAQDLMVRVTGVFSEDNINRVAMTLENFEALSGMVKSDYPLLPGAVDEAHLAITDIRQAVGSIKQFANSANSTVRTIDGQASGELAATLRSLREASDNLVRITAHFDAAPAEYVLGREALPVYRADGPESTTTATAAAPEQQ
jgi:phospholipid/cholesterol/gamma-HCH transport system substrate-binding protein